MFEGFANQWTPVALSSDLPRDRPFSLQIAGTRVVLFRDATGEPRALLDQCPHRGVALSLGRVQSGRIECPFHGWQLEGTGQVCHVPWNPDAKLGTLRGVPFPTRELAGQIWLYTAPVEHPTTEPTAHEALSRPGVRVSGFAVEWNTHWTRAMENMLDWPHLPFVHIKTIGKSLEYGPDKRMDITWEDRPYGAHTHIQIDGNPQPGSLDFRWPNQMNLHIPIPGKLLVMAVTCLPVDPTPTDSASPPRTRLLLTMARDFLTHPLFDWIFHRQNLKIATEDRAIVESSFPPVVPPPTEERSVRTDAPTLAFRKRYFADLHTSRALLSTPDPKPRVKLPISLAS